MKRSQRQQAACAILLAGWCAFTVDARAQSPAGQSEPESTRFEFRAPEGCGSAEDFAERVRRRSSRIRLVAGGAAPRSLVVEIQELSADGALRGTVKVIEPDGATRTRQLKANSCAEAVDALSLIATVTLDPDALSGESPEPEPASPPTSKPPPKAAIAPPAPPPTPRASLRYRASFGAAATALFDVAPKAVVGGSVAAALELTPGSVVAPFARLSLTHAERRALPESVGKASFAFTFPTLDLCPARFGPRFVGIRPCAFTSLGLLKVWGNATLQNETHSRFYGAAGVALWGGLRVSEAFEIIVDGRAGRAFRRDAYAFDDVVFYRTTALGFSAEIGVAGGFP